VSLTLKIERDVQPKEITGLIYGTGGNSNPWWNTIEWRRFTDGGEKSVRLAVADHELDEALEDDWFVFHHDTLDDEEGTWSGRTRVTMQQLVDAASEAWPQLAPEAQRDMAEDLAQADADAADIVMQMAVFKDLVFG